MKKYHHCVKFNYDNNDNGTDNNNNGNKIEWFNLYQDMEPTLHCKHIGSWYGAGTSNYPKC